MKIKNKKSHLMVSILILDFGIILQGLHTHFNEQSVEENKRIINYLSATDSYVYEWNRTWGGTDNDRCSSVAVDSSNNVYILGTTVSFGAGYSDIALVKYDNTGVEQWNRIWGGSDLDYGYGIAIDSSDNMYLAGTTLSFGAGEYDLVLVKYDNSGVKYWSRTWGGSDLDYGEAVAVDSLENVYLVGTTNSFGAGYSDMVLVKYNSSGVQQWSRTWGGNNMDYGEGVAVDSSENVYVMGATYSFGAGNYDMVLVKYDNSGIQQWNRTWGGIDLDFGHGVAIDSSDNIYLAGKTKNFGVEGTDMILVKYDNSGVQQWSRTWGGIRQEWGFEVAVDSLNNIYLAGFTTSVGAGDYNMVIVEYDNSGGQQWNHTWGGSGTEWSYGVTVDSSDNVYVVGYTDSFGAGGYDMAVVKYIPYTDKQEAKPAISGYSILLFITAIGLITVIYLKKKTINLNF